MDQVLRIEPPEIVFSIRPGHLSSFSAQFTNLHHTPIAYNVRTTVPKRYCVQVNKAILQPGESKSLLFSQQPYSVLPDSLACKDRFQVLVRKLDTPDLLHLSVPQVWESTSVFDYERKFRVKLVVIDQPQSIPFDPREQPSDFHHYPLAPGLPAPPSGILDQNDLTATPPPPSPPPPPLPPTPPSASANDFSLSGPLFTNPVQIPPLGNHAVVESLQSQDETTSLPLDSISSRVHQEEHPSGIEAVPQLSGQHPLEEEIVEEEEVEIVKTPLPPTFDVNEEVPPVRVPPVPLHQEERPAVTNPNIPFMEKQQDLETNVPIDQEKVLRAAAVFDVKREEEIPSLPKKPAEIEARARSVTEIASSNSEPLAATAEINEMTTSEVKESTNPNSESREEIEEKERRMTAERARVAALMKKKNDEEEKKRAIEEKRLEEELKRVAEEEEKKRKEEEEKRAAEEERLRVEEEARLAREAELEKQRTRAEVLRGRSAPSVEFGGMSSEQEHRAAVDRCVALYRMISEREKETRKLSLELREAKHMLSNARIGVGPLYELSYEPDTRFPISQVALMAAISGALLSFFL